MEKERSFHHKHPVMTGVAILGGLFIFSWIGMTFFFSNFSSSQGSGIFTAGTGKIGVVELKGVITSPEKALSDLTSFRKDRSIKAIVLRIDSPGGAVGASQEIFEEVKRTSKAKPVIASMGSIAASGGYYAALGASSIVASPGTLTGSIGVIIKFANLAEIFKKIGYSSEVVKSGAMKDVGSSARPMTEEEKELIQRIIDSVHNQFIKAVSESRDIPLDKVRELADGRIYSGEQALEAGLIDQFGNLNDAVMLAAKMAGLKEELPPLVYRTEENFSLLKLLVGESRSGVFRDISFLHPVLSYEWSIAQ
ncbi:MAG: signal peptide peptidase SppA [Thermodesulfobacteriota bacterium]